MTRLGALVLIALLTGCATTDSPAPAPATTARSAPVTTVAPVAEPTAEWLAGCVEDWRIVYTDNGTRWPGDADMYDECRLEWRLRQSSGN